MRGSRGAFNRVFLSGRILDVRTSAGGARLRLAARFVDDVGRHTETITVVAWRTSTPLRAGNEVLATGSLRTNPLAIVEAEVALLSDVVSRPDSERTVDLGEAKERKEHGVVRHQRTLPSGRVIWVVAHRRGKKKP